MDVSEWSAFFEQIARMPNMFMELHFMWRNEQEKRVPRNSNEIGSILMSINLGERVSSSHIEILCVWFCNFSPIWFHKFSVRIEITADQKHSSSIGINSTKQMKQKQDMVEMI